MTFRCCQTSCAGVRSQGMYSVGVISLEIPSLFIYVWKYCFNIAVIIRRISESNHAWSCLGDFTLYHYKWMTKKYMWSQMELNEISWWCNQMETFSALMAICAGNLQVTGEFPAQRPVTRSFDIFFNLHLNKRLSKQWWGWWFEKPSCPLRRHCNE